LAERFETIIVTPLYKGNTQLNFSHPKISIQQFDAFLPCNRLKVLFQNFGLVLKVYVSEFFSTHHKFHYIIRFPSLVNTLILRIASAKALKQMVGSHSSTTVFYSYWFSQFAFILCLMKKMDPTIKAVSRAHGSDYNEAQTNSVLPFRYFQLNTLNAIIPVSQYAANYLVKQFDVNAKKMKVNRLGLEEADTLAPIDKNVLHIVSCSNLIPLKRVHLIPQILKHVTKNVTWDHFGAGPEMERVKKECASLPSNVKYNLRGHVPNRDLVNFISEEPTSFFINVSEFEGIPVTLMEAASVGIPLIGTNVCGIPEVVTDFLIPVDMDPGSIAELIEREHLTGKIYDKDHRQKIQDHFNATFSAKKNFSELGDFLYSLN
jgi:glycosyltransferase involved in cell wall biosynthesis